MTSHPFNLILLSAWHEQFGNGLLRFLDGHPQCMAYPFESLLATPLSTNLLAGPVHAVPQRYAYPEFPMDVTPREAYQMMQDGELKTYLRTPKVSKFKDCGLVMDERLRELAFEMCFKPDEGRLLVDGVSVPGLPKSRAGYVEAFFRSTFEAWSNFARTGQETHYVGYSPPILFDTDKVFSDFPTSHMVHIVRNPWSGYADTKRRPFPMSLTRYCQVWSHVQLAALQYQVKYPGQFHVIRYEDLVADPMGTLNLVLAKVGLEPFKVAPVPSFNRKALDQVYPWGTIRSATTEANTATAEELTEEETLAVVDETGVMAALLYPELLETP